MSADILRKYNKKTYLIDCAQSSCTTCVRCMWESVKLTALLCKSYSMENNSMQWNLNFPEESDDNSIAWNNDGLEFPQDTDDDSNLNNYGNLEFLMTVIIQIFKKDLKVK